MLGPRQMMMINVCHVYLFLFVECNWPLMCFSLHFSCHGRPSCTMAFSTSGYGYCTTCINVRSVRNFLFINYSCHKCEELLTASLQFMFTQVLQTGTQIFFLVSVDPETTLLLNKDASLSGQEQVDLLSPNYPCFAPRQVFNISCTIRQMLHLYCLYFDERIHSGQEFTEKNSQKIVCHFFAGQMSLKWSKFYSLKRWSPCVVQEPDVTTHWHLCGMARFLNFATHVMNKMSVLSWQPVSSN